MKCRLCKKAGRPAHFGQDRECAFEANEFSGRNWNCATMNILRTLCGEDSPLIIPQDLGESLVFSARVGDSSIGVLPGYDDSFIVLSWYKRRGCTSRALYVSDENVRALTINEAETAIAENIKNDPLILVDADGDPVFDI